MMKRSYILFFFYSSEFVTCLEDIGLKSLLHSKTETKHGKSQEMLGDVHLQIAQYCRKILENRKDKTYADRMYIPMSKFSSCIF